MTRGSFAKRPAFSASPIVLVVVVVRGGPLTPSPLERGTPEGFLPGNLTDSIISGPFKQFAFGHLVLPDYRKKNITCSVENMASEGFFYDFSYTVFDIHSIS